MLDLDFAVCIAHRSHDRSNVSDINSASCSATRRSSYTRETAPRASTLALRCDSMHDLGVWRPTHCYRKTSPTKSDSSSLFPSSSSGELVFLSLVLQLTRNIFNEDKDYSQVRIGRIAGQYAKPRSSAMEKIGDREVMSFRYG